MTDQVTLLRCAYCGKPHTYTPTPDDKCAPGSPNQVCDACVLILLETVSGEAPSWLLDEPQDAEGPPREEPHDGPS
jgi:hypothetical protein